MRLLRSAPALRVTRPLAAAQRVAMAGKMPCRPVRPASTPSRSALGAMPGRLLRPRVRVGPRRQHRRASRQGRELPGQARRPAPARRGTHRAGLWRATAARPSDRGRGAGRAAERGRARREFSPPFQCALIRRSTSCDMPIYCNPPCRLQHNRYTDQEPLSALERAANLAKPAMIIDHINTPSIPPHSGKYPVDEIGGIMAEKTLLLDPTPDGVLRREGNGGACRRSGSCNGAAWAHGRPLQRGRHGRTRRRCAVVTNLCKSRGKGVTRRVTLSGEAVTLSPGVNLLERRGRKPPLNGGRRRPLFPLRSSGDLRGIPGRSKNTS